MNAIGGIQGKRICVIGGGGFLGWHIRLHAWAYGWRVQSVSTRTDSPEAIAAAIGTADHVVHLAACNRPRAGETDADAAKQTAAAGRITATALRAATNLRESKQLGPLSISIAGTTQSGTPYGDAKAIAADEIFSAATELDASCTQWLLPNLFGEHARPHHNMVTATFINEILHNRPPKINGDSPLTLLAARHAARLLLMDSTPGTHHVTSEIATLHETTVPDLANHIARLDADYRVNGTLPDFGDPFMAELFAAYLSQRFSMHQSIPLVPHSDARGTFVETGRCLGQGQTSFSTTAPGVTRGNHLHLHKIERFVVLRGQARIELRRFDTNERIAIDVTGDQPRAVDMPCGWSHNITNTGSDTLYTQFWISELFDPSAPDTYFEEV